MSQQTENGAACCQPLKPKKTRSAKGPNDPNKQQAATKTKSRTNEKNERTTKPTTQTKLNNTNQPTTQHNETKTHQSAKHKHTELFSKPSRYTNSNQEELPGVSLTL